MSTDQQHQEHPQDQNQFQNQPRNNEECRLFVGNLSWGTTDDALHDAFHKFNVTRAKVIFDRVSGRSRGFGFVSFATQDDAERAMSEMHESMLDGRNIRVDKATSQQRR